MVGEIETSPIITRMKLIMDETGANEMVERVSTFTRGIDEITHREITPFKPKGFRLEEIIKPLQNLEDRLDVSATVDTSTKAIQRYDEEFSKLAKTTESFEGLEDRLDISKTMENSWSAMRKFDVEFSNTITPVKNLENQLDTMNGAFRGSTEALVVSDSEFNNLYGNLLNVDEAINHTTTSIERYGKTTQITTTITNQFGDVIATNTRTMEQNFARFNMWALSIMFFGMQIQRIFGKMWTSMKDAYFKITENTTALGQANLRLSASMTFLQVSIMTALEPALLPLVETIIDLVNWFNELPEPIKEVAGTFVIGGYFAGGILSGLGSITMFISMGLIPLIAKLTGPGGVVTEAIAAGSALTTAFPAALSIGLSVYMLTKQNDLWASIIGLFTAALAGYMIAGPPGAIAAVAIAVIFEIITEPYFAEFRGKLEKLRNQFIQWVESLRLSLMETLHGIPLLGNFFVTDIELQRQQDKVNTINSYLDEGERFWQEYDSTIGKTGDTTTKTITDIQSAFDIIFGPALGRAKGILDRLIGSIFGESPGLIPGLISISSLAKEIVPPAIDIMISSINASANAFNTATSSVNSYVVALSRIPNVPNIGTTKISTTNAFNTTTDVLRVAKNIFGGMAEGGIVTSPQLKMIGETGPEAIIPLRNIQSPSINVGDINIDITTGPVNNELDIKDLADKVSEEIMRDIRNYTKYVPQW